MAALLILGLTLSFAGCFSLAAVSFRARQRTIVKTFLAVMFLYCWWCFCALMVIISPTLEEKIFYSRVKFFGICLLCPFWTVLSVWWFAEWKHRTKQWASVALMIPGFALFLCAVLPATRDLFITDFELLSRNGATTVKYVDGPLFKLHSGYALFLAIVLYGLIFYHSHVKSVIIRSQAWAIILASSLHTLLDLIGVLFQLDTRWFQMSLVALFPLTMVVFYSLYRYELLDIIPLAKDRILKTLPSPILVFSNGSRLWYFNEAAEKVFGLSHFQIGKPADWVLSKDVVSLLYEESSKEYQWETAGQTLWYQVTRHPVVDQKMTGSILMFNDVTAVKLFEAEVSEKNELLQLSVDFKDRLLSVISHDLLGNVAGLRMILSSFEDHPDAKKNTPFSKSIQSMQNATDSTIQSFQNLLHWATSETGDLQSHKSSFDVVKLIEDCKAQLLGQVNAKDISIYISSSAPVIVMLGHERMIASAIRNLLANAVQYSQQGGIISVTASAQAATSELKISVLDEGLGMSEVAIANLFTQVQQPGQPHSNGLGLYFTNDFITKHGGRISVQSKVGEGSLFEVILPLT